MQEDFFHELRREKKIEIRVIPNAKKTEVIGKMTDGRWKVRIAAVPEDGKANSELLRFLKKQGIQAIILGEKNRNKTLQNLENSPISS